MSPWFFALAAERAGASRGHGPDQIDADPTKTFRLYFDRMKREAIDFRKAIGFRNERALPTRIDHWDGNAF
jgi:hypothetical protein